MKRRRRDPAVDALLDQAVFLLGELQAVSADLSVLLEEPIDDTPRDVRLYW